MKVNMVLAFLLIVILFSPAYAQMMPMMGMGVFMGTMEAEHETHVHPFLALLHVLAYFTYVVFFIYRFVRAI